MISAIRPFGYRIARKASPRHTVPRMIWTASALTIYCVLILLASLLGGWIPIAIKLTHKRMEVAVSFVAGVMLGVGVLHMLPHALEAALESQPPGVHAHEALGPVMLWLIAGFLAMFFIERFFRFHHHDAPAAEHAADHHHDHHSHEHRHRHGMTWAGAAVGLSLHSLIEGIALASSVEAAGHENGAAIAGLATFLVIFLHKPFDALTIGTLMAVGKRTAISRHVVNLAFSLLIPVGVALFYLGAASYNDQPYVVSAALAFSAGTFLCISMSDLLPELQFHHHDRVKLSAALLLGLALAWGISALESRMHHDHPTAVAQGFSHSTALPSVTPLN